MNTLNTELKEYIILTPCMLTKLFGYLPGPINLENCSPKPQNTAHINVILATKSSSMGLNRFHLQMKRYFITKMPNIRNRNPFAIPPFSNKLR